MSEKDTLVVLGASYDSVADAEVDYEAVKDLYAVAGVGHDFDAAVVQRGPDGKVKVLDKHEASTRHGAWTGLAIGAPWPRSCRGSVWLPAPRSARGSAPSPGTSRAG
jgi:hypothetical protein